MTSLINDLKESYINWLRSNFKLRDLDGVIEITTPMMDRHNDFLQIYAVQRGDKLRLTDDGYIMSDLRMAGIDIENSKRRQEIFSSVLNGYGVMRSDQDELYVEANIDNFPQRKHMLVQAMMAVNDMFMITRSNVQSIFLEDVENFLEENEVRFSPNISFTGKSGYTHRFDFVIPKSKFHPERVVQTLNLATKQATTNIIFAWQDTRETRKNDSSLYVFLNDSFKLVASDIVAAYTGYDIHPVLWSQRAQALQYLSA